MSGINEQNGGDVSARASSGFQLWWRWVLANAAAEPPPFWFDFSFDGPIILFVVLASGLAAQATVERTQAEYTEDAVGRRVQQLVREMLGDGCADRR